MHNLAIECSGIGGSIAVFRDTCQLASCQLPSDRSSVQSLAMSIRDMLQATAAGQPDLLSVTCGPGSFTGLRVGLATAKMLSLAWHIPIAGVDSLSAIALHASRHIEPNPEQPTVVVAVLNAFRKQVFAAAWRIAGDALEPLASAQVVDASAWLAAPYPSLTCDKSARTKLPPPAETRCLISGPGLANYLPAPQANQEIVPEAYWAPRAIEVAQLGRLAFQAGAAVSAGELHPNYVRASAAEEKSPGR